VTILQGSKKDWYNWVGTCKATDVDEDQDKLGRK
jgi:hypothetical protein